MANLDDLRRACAHPLPHPDEATLRQAGLAVLDWTLQHHTTLRDQSIGLTASRPTMDALLQEPPPEEGTDFTAVLGEFAGKVAPYAFRVNHPRFAAFIPSAPNLLSVLGDWLCAASNFFAGVWLEAAGPAEVELVVLDWFRTVLGLPSGTRGLLTSGGSEANLTALATARELLSYEDRSRAALYLSPYRHRSVDRAARILGLRPDQLHPVPGDDHYRLDPTALSHLVASDREKGWLPWTVVANAGATDTGGVDPLGQLADVCARDRLWLHVDAAYGWTAALDAQEGKALEGIGRADSVTMDPHKWLAQTFEAGAVLVRRGELLGRTFSQRPDYMQDVAPSEIDEINFCEQGIALTRRFRALKLWLSIKALGLGWYRRLVRHCCQLAALAEALLRQTPGFEILSPRSLSIFCFRHVPPAWDADDPETARRLDAHNLALVEALRATGRAFLSSTRLEGRVALRMCFINWRTCTADVEEVVSLLAKLAEGLS